ncbi:MAG: UDP-N-acetylmuramoyl-L-alanine--D-glutamate ligase [Bradymonadales bacterium]|jgi:UDP-N-acetylmuramoylalanine--D-glutamate ligase
MQDPLLHDPLPQHECVAIFGLGDSGIAAAHLLADFGKSIIASDIASESRRAEFEAKLPKGTKLVLGKNDFSGATIIVTSPGLSPYTPIFEDATKAGIPIIAELELASRCSPTPIVAVTGTDGKTTTTTMVSHILRLCGRKNRMGGNIGIPFSHIVQDSPSLDCFVIETSAFQLPFCPTLKPHVLIATNLAEDHSEYFQNNWDAYVEAKRKPLAPMIASDTAVLNASDPEIAAWRTKTQARLFWYAQKQSDIPHDALNFAYINDENLHFVFEGESYSFSRSQLRVKGMHNAMNALASASACLSLGCNFADIVLGLSSFVPPPHRIERVTEFDGVVFYDDSKATNPHAAMAALKTLDMPTVLIAGGVDKGLRLSEWIAAMGKNVKALFAIGELSERLIQEVREAKLGFATHSGYSLEDSTRLAFLAAKELGASCVLLSPACSSYDMFKNYEQRGEVFAHAALQLGRVEALEPKRRRRRRR